MLQVVKITIANGPIYLNGNKKFHYFYLLLNIKACLLFIPLIPTT